MPTFENVEVQTTIDVDFEVFCGTCGEGLCSESDTRNRNFLQVTVNACPTCMDEKEEEIKELKAQIESLEEELENNQ